MARCTNAPVFERPEEEVAEKEMEIFEYLEREVLENERCVTYKEVAAKVDYYFIEVAKAVKKFYEEHKNRPGLTAIFNISGIKWHETEADFKARKRVDPEAIRESTIRNMLATAEEFEQFKEEVDEVRQEMVYSLQFEKKFQDVESLLKEDEKLMAAEEDIERWFQRCWWRRGDPQTCRQEMLNSGAVDMYHKVTKEPGKPLSRVRSAYSASSKRFRVLFRTPTSRRRSQRKLSPRLIRRSTHCSPKPVLGRRSRNPIKTNTSRNRP
ncbi:hypothetical protein L596_019625 [Steinernema carpocapsae]|uniref:Uncharacterized protein n=1 Tax=Steinernema carpocapsae TaxID=34508 RepID=A0A4V6A0N3_STECR|nr:hypothetical protein L596_019625 [Steinernema carpocapsae]